jgi:hypothetical protein
MSKEVVVVIIVMVVKTDLWGLKSGMEETGGRDKRGGGERIWGSRNVLQLMGHKRRKVVLTLAI